MGVETILAAFKQGIDAFMGHLRGTVRSRGGCDSGPDVSKGADDSLREAYEKYRIVVDHTYDWEYWVGPDSRFIYVSPSCSRITGYQEEEFITNPDLFMEIVHPEDKALVRHHWHEIGEAHGPDQLEFRILCRDGTMRWIGHVCQPVYDKDGKFLGRRGSNRSITKRKRTEEALRESELRLKAVVDNLPVGVWFTDENGMIIYSNSVGREIWSGARYVGPEEFHEYKAWWADTGKLLTPDDWAVARAVRKGETSLNEVLKIQCFDNSVKTILNSAVPLRDSEGRIFSVAVLNEDITEKKAAEDALRESEDRYRSLVEYSPEGIAVHSNGRFVYINPAGASILGAESPEKMIGRSIYDIIHPDSLDSVKERIRNTEHGSPTPLMQQKLIRLDGKAFFAEVVGIPFKYNDRTATQIILRDITDRKQAEEQIGQLNQKLRHRVQELEAVFNAAPIGLAIAEDPEGIHIRGNPTNERMLGVPPDAELSKRWSPDREEGRFRALQDGRELTVEELPMQRAVRGETVTGQTMDVIREDGKTVTLFSNAVPLLDERGKPRGAVGAFMDITELKEAEEELRKSNRRLEILAETASRLLISGRPQMIINELCRKIMAHLDCQVFFNYLVDEQKNCLQLNAWEGIPEETAHGIEWLDYGAAVCGCVARDGRRIVAEHIFETQDPRTDLVRSFGIKAYACHPLISQGRVIGTLSFGTRTRPYFTEEELALMRAVTDQVAIALERMRNIEELKTAREDLQRSHDVLETRVRERTEELWRTVARLETEAAERLKAEEALRESQEKLDNTLQSITDGFFTLDRSWRFTYLNDETERIMGRKRENLIGKTLWEIAPMAHGTVFEEQYRKAMIDRVPISFEAVSLLLKVWVDIRAYPTAEGIAVYVRDITERKKAEEALRLATAYNRSLIEASPDPLVTIDPDGRISDVNTATENVTGYSRQEVIGTDFSDYFTDPEKARQGYRLVFQEGLVRDYALEIRHREGGVTPVLYNATVYRDEAGKVIGIFAAARDITERLKMEEKLRQTNEQLRSLASELLMAEESERRRISVDLHDNVSQSLAVAKLRLDTLQERAQECGMIEPIQDVRKLIDESIKQTRSLMTELSPSVLYELGFEPAVEWLTEHIRTKHGISVKFESDLRTRRLGQDIQILLFQAVRELLVNVVKHAKTIVASISIREFGDHIRVTVRDDGVGFDVSRIDAGVDAEGGFGLFSLRERLQYFGGQLKITTRPGKGTSVTVEVPRRKSRKTQRRARHGH